MHVCALDTPDTPCYRTTSWSVTHQAWLCYDHEALAARVAYAPSGEDAWGAAILRTHAAAGAALL